VKTLTALESTSDERITLRNFWPNTPNDYLPKLDSDVSKAFLTDLIQLAIGDSDINIVVTSVNEKTKSGISRVSHSTLNKTLNLLTPNKSNKVLAEYGHRATSSPISDRVNIWYSGENKRPPLGEQWDSFMSYDVDAFGGKNIYLPLWVTRLAPTVESAIEQIEKLTLTRSYETSREKGFCAVISNPEPVRMQFIRLLRKKVDVDVFGRMGEQLENKNKTLSNYKFNLCFENDEYPGYVTEKPFEAWMSGCIPIWRGIDKQRYLNSDALVNVSESSFDEAIDFIIDLSHRNDDIQRIRNLPILQRRFDINAVIVKLRKQIFET
jgi:hypothetical protein